jgi:bacterioferritin
MSNDVIKELNAFLKGQYMGIHAYENYIQKAKEPNIKAQFQKIQQEHKIHAAKVAERIQNLGGKPVEDEGFVGSMKQLMMDIKGIPDTTEGLIKGALKGEDLYGIQLSEEIVKGDLDQESHNLIKGILDEDQNHVNTLNQLVQ